MSFTTKDHLAQVLEAYSHPVDERAGELARAAIRHLFAFIEEVGLTREEWFAGVGLLTAIGHMSDDKRQEFILLSDTIGASMLVEMINQNGAPGTTDPTVFGPFHRPGAPFREMGDSIVTDDPGGEPRTFRGTVTDLDGNPIEGAQLDVWQGASNGLYDVQDDGQPDMNMRGVFTTGADGSYHFVTSRPVPYPIPGDGPVGAILRACGRHNFRPAHTHVLLTAPGHKPIITHLFDRESAHLDSDAVFGVRDGLVVDMSGPEVVFDFVMEPEPTTL
ncbi:MAG TPA: dioxygenase [Ilumatobacter sp.]|nr:dioxygenase [Ilumatobacter sp.]